MEDEAVTVRILQLEHPAAWKCHDFHGDFHASRAGRVKGGVEIRHFKSQGEESVEKSGVKGPTPAQYLLEDIIRIESIV